MGFDFDQRRLELAHGEGAGAHAHGQRASTEEDAAQHLYALAGHETKLEQAAPEPAVVTRGHMHVADGRHLPGRQLVQGEPVYPGGGLVQVDAHAALSNK
jgi:predicted ABC-class ATPase